MIILLEFHNSLKQLTLFIYEDNLFVFLIGVSEINEEFLELLHVLLEILGECVGPKNLLIRWVDFKLTVIRWHDPFFLRPWS